jgi:hypothetical protein
MGWTKPGPLASDEVTVVYPNPCVKGGVFGNPLHGLARRKKHAPSRLAPSRAIDAGSGTEASVRFNIVTLLVFTVFPLRFSEIESSVKPKAVGVKARGVEG